MRPDSPQTPNIPQPVLTQPPQIYPSRKSYHDSKKDTAGFSFSKGRNKIKIAPMDPEIRKNIKSNEINESSEEYVGTSNHRTEESLLTENKELESSGTTVIQRQIWDAAINMDLEDVKQTRAQERSKKFLMENMLKTGESAGVNQLMITKDQNAQSFFAKFIFTVMVIIHLYNFFTCFFFMGIEGYPEGAWFVLEILFEALMLFELCVQCMLRTQTPWLWKEMQILHISSIQENLSKFQQLQYLINAFPKSLVLSFALKNDQATLYSFGIACLRMMKLFRFNEVKKLFDHIEMQTRKNSAFSVSRILFTFIFFAVFVHFWTCIWLITGRIDWSRNVAGWYRMDKFEMNPTMLEMYFESLHFIITTFSGAGFGNIVPSTNFEWFVGSILDLIGSALFICIFVDFVMEFQMRDLKKYHNDNLLDETMQFAESTSLPESFDFKIRYYYKDLYLQFQDFLLKKQIVEEMPHTIQGQVSIMLNREIIESVKFFQLATPEFISEISCLLCPQICMNDDYIFRIDDNAEKMYFVHSGYIEILCKNGVSPMVYFGKGAYFGEIGVLITGKRSVSVRSKSNSVVYYINKPDLLKLLEMFPDQRKFLTEVAKQRLQTTPYEARQQSNTSLSSVVQSKQSNAAMSKHKEIQQLFERATLTAMASKPWFNQRLQSQKRYIMLPFSPLWWLWNLTLVVAIFMNSLIIPYGIGFEQDLSTSPFIIFALVVYVIDIPIRMRTGVTQNHEISIESRIILRWYLDRWSVLDALATFPFEYVMIITNNTDYTRYVLLFRLLKVGRLVETCEIIRKNSRHSYATLCFFMELVCLFGYLMHWIACLYGWLGRRELNRNPRYDGNTLFKDFDSRPFLTLGPLEDLTDWGQYTVCLYVAGSLIAAATYGDCIPSTIPEQIVCMAALITTQTMRSFLFVRIAKYYGNQQQQQMLKINKSNAILKYMNACKLPPAFMKKIKEFTHSLRHSKSQWEGSDILQHLPNSLQNEIKDHLEKSQIKVAPPARMQMQLKHFFKSKVVASQDNGIEIDDNLDQMMKLDLSKEYGYFLKMKHFKEAIVLIVVTWNIWFIPLQFSYKIPFEGVFLAFEIITMLVYLADIGFCYHTISWLKNLNCVEDELLRRKDRKIRQSIFFMKKEVQAQHQQIGITLVALIPMSLILMSLEQAKDVNMFVIVFLCSLRLIKLQPLHKLFKQKQKDNLVKWRILSTIYIYYCFVHLCANIMIYMALQDEDWTTNWLRRCPVPQDLGSSQDGSYRDDMSPLSIYVHALYYCVSNVSHVAIADISAVSQKEFVANAIFGWIGFFFYCITYADITLLMSNASSSNYKNFMVKRKEIIQKLKSPSIPKSIVLQAALYLDYTYEVYEGVAQDEVLSELPDKLKMDFLLEKYKKITEQSILFRIPSTAGINPALTSDVLKFLKVQIFMSETFILKVGQVCKEAIFVLEGNLNVLTIRKQEILGSLTPGDYYATDLDSFKNELFDEEFFRRTQKDAPPMLNIDPLDNFDSRSLVHLIARAFVTIGYISDEQLDLLYRRHPSLKSVMRRSNRYIFDVGRKAVEYELAKEHKVIDRQACVDLLEDHYEKSSDDHYREIVRFQRSYLSFLKVDEEAVANVSKNTKLYWIKQLPNRQNRSKFLRLFVEEKKVGQSSKFVECCEELVIYEQSIFRKIIKYVMFANRIYVAIALPFYIGFDIRIKGEVLGMEIFSHCISFIVFVLEFRTPVVKESGELTLEFDSVVRNYIKNGMFLDVLAFQPFNVILPLIFNRSESGSYEELAIIIGLTPFRMIRLVSVQRVIALYNQFKIDFRGKQQLLTNIGNLCFIFLISHWCVCSWVFLTFVVESMYAVNWFKYRLLGVEPLWVQYLRSYYAVANIVSSVGSGDVFGTTDLERIFLTALMTAADVVFALAFGLIAEITSNQRANNPEQNFCTKLVQAEMIMGQSKFNANWKDRVQQYMTYKHQLKTSSKNLNADDLKDSLPDCLIKEILYHSNRPILTQLFKGINSENLMRDLAFATTTRIFMPDDVILMRKQKVESIYCIVEGTCAKYNKKNNVIEKFQAGDFIGQDALHHDIRPKFTVRAQTFMLVKVIAKSDVESILSQYPLFYKEFVNQKDEPIQANVEQSFADIEAASLRGTVQQPINSSMSYVESESDSDSSDFSEEEEVGSIQVLPQQIKKNENHNARRQTWDSKRLFESRRLNNGQQKTKNTELLSNLAIPQLDKRESQESMANLVLKEYQRQKTTKIKQSKGKTLQRRLSNVTIGSKLVIHQGEGRSLAFDVDQI